MKKALLYLTTFSSLCLLLQLDGTTAYLTSDKMQESPVSLGSNRDVFAFEEKEILLSTSVHKKIKIKRTNGPGGQGGGESSTADTSIERGSAVIVFKPQRPHLTLDPSNFSVTGDAADDIAIVPVAVAEQENGIAFMIEHKLDAVQKKNDTVTGLLHVQALGGFYNVTVPLKIRTSYKETTVVTEVNAPPPSAPPPGTPGGNTPTPTSPPPNTGGGGQPPTPPTGSTPDPAPTPQPDTPSQPDTPNPDSGTPGQGGGGDSGGTPGGSGDGTPADGGGSTDGSGSSDDGGSSDGGGTSDNGGSSDGGGSSSMDR